MTQSAQKAQEPLTLVSHTLCPYVQRAVIALTEKGVPFERKDVDLSNKPDWFKKISPLGKTPVLVVGEQPIFESAVIAEYLEETAPNPLHPKDALARADHRARAGPGLGRARHPGVAPSRTGVAGAPAARGLSAGTGVGGDAGRAGAGNPANPSVLPALAAAADGSAPKLWVKSREGGLTGRRMRRGFNT